MNTTERFDLETCRYCGKTLAQDVKVYRKIHKTGKETLGVLHFDIRVSQCNCPGRKLGLAILEGRDEQ